MRRKRDLQRITGVAQGTTNHNFPPVEVGKTIRLKMFGALDINNGDNNSSVYQLLWGDAGTSFQLLKMISVSGNTVELPMKDAFRGNGVKHLRVRYSQNSPTNKDMVFWVDSIKG